MAVPIPPANNNHILQENATRRQPQSDGKSLPAARLINAKARLFEAIAKLGADAGGIFFDLEDLDRIIEESRFKLTRDAKPSASHADPCEPDSSDSDSSQHDPREEGDTQKP